MGNNLTSFLFPFLPPPLSILSQAHPGCSGTQHLEGEAGIQAEMSRDIYKKCQGDKDGETDTQVGERRQFRGRGSCPRISGLRKQLLGGHRGEDVGTSEELVKAL